MKKAVVELANMGHPDADPKLIGRNIHVMLTPLPPNKRKPRFLMPEDAEDGEAAASNHGHETGRVANAHSPSPPPRASA
jgi:translation initiation factor IF-3